MSETPDVRENVERKIGTRAVVPESVNDGKYRKRIRMGTDGNSNYNYGDDNFR